MQEGYGDFLGYSVLIVPSFFAILEGEGLLFFEGVPLLPFTFLLLVFLLIFLRSFFKGALMLMYLLSLFTSRGHSNCCIPPFPGCCLSPECHVYLCIPFQGPFVRNHLLGSTVSQTSQQFPLRVGIPFCGGILLEVIFVLPPLGPHSTLLPSSQPLPVLRMKSLKFYPTPKLTCKFYGCW